MTVHHYLYLLLAVCYELHTGSAGRQKLQGITSKSFSLLDQHGITLFSIQRHWTSFGYYCINGVKDLLSLIYVHKRQKADEIAKHGSDGTDWWEELELLAIWK
jgi:hypothetical protein